MDTLWRLIPVDPQAQVLIGIAFGSVLGLVIVAAWGLLDLPVTWRIGL